ncbi:MAG: lipopolysaccharide biosynthesis protein [Paludibacteraceae bacterium]|nr:lipopolysaccharide biosynthesis protein [Paludibacteraceae bacterium]
MAENSSNQRIAKNTVFLYFRSLLLMIIGLYTSRVTLQVLGVEDFGIYQVVGGVVAMFSILSSTLQSASQRFITFSLGANDKIHQKTVFSTCVSMHVLLALLAIIFLEVLGLWFLNTKLNIPAERIEIARWVFHLSIANFFIGIVSVPYNAVIIAHEKMSAFAYMGILEASLKLFSVYFLSSTLWDKLYFYAFFLFLVSLLMQVIYMFYSRLHFDEAKSISIKIDNAVFAEMFSFAGWNLFGNGSMVLRNQGVDIVLNIFFGVVVNAAKGICNQVQNAVQQLVGNFTMAMKPQLTIAVAQKDYNRAFILVNNGSKYSFFLMLLFSVPIMVSAPQLLSIWLIKVPDYTIEFVRWTLVYLLLDTLSRMLIHLILSDGRIKHNQIAVGGTKLLAIPLVLISIQLGCGPLTGIIVNIILEIICLGERLYFTKKLVNFDWMNYIYRVIIPCCIISIIAGITSFLFMKYVTDLFLPEVAVSLLITVTTIWVFGLSPKEKSMVLMLITTKVFHK